MAIQSALIVDDSKLARITLRKKLQRHGVEAAVAESALEALEMIKANRPQIVFMDHLMPDMDGFEATKVIRSMPGMETLPIVMCTGKDHEGYLAEAQSVGANSTLTKPPTEGSLAAVLSMDFSQLSSSHNHELLVDASETCSDSVPLLDDPAAPVGESDMLSLSMDDAAIDLSNDLDDVGSSDRLDDESLDDLLSGLLHDADAEASLVVAEPARVTEANDLGMSDAESPVEIENTAASPSLSEVPVIDQALIAELVNAQLASVQGALMQSVEALVATSVNDAVGKLSAPLHEKILNDVIGRVEDDVARQVAAIPSTLTPEAINKLMVQKMQLLWKKTNIAITDSADTLKSDIAVQSDAVIKQLEEKLVVSTSGPVDGEDDLLAENVDSQVRAMQIELMEAKSSIRAAKVIGFAGFVSGAAAAGYLAANFLGYV